MDIFEKKIREIFSFITEYGITNKPLDFTSPEAISEKDREEFLIQVHKGFRLGQEYIIKEILSLQIESKEKKAEFTTARESKNKDLQTVIQANLNQIKHHIAILRHFADFIAWQLMGNHYYVARRYYSGKTERPDLLNTNLESVIKASDYLHKKDEKKFALITDLTSFIDIGDILLTDGKNLSVIEVKAGDVQQEVFSFINQLADDDFKPENIDYKNKNDKFFKQTERTLNQIKKAQKLVSFLQNEKGKDPFSDTEIVVRESTAVQEKYYGYFMELIKESKNKGFAYGEIENVIFIGMYRGNRRSIGRVLMAKILEETCEEKFPILDYISLIHMPLREPLFFKPFGQETFYDLMFGRLKIYLSVDINELIKLFNSKGIESKWLSTKKTHEQNEKRHHHYKVFTHNNRAIQIKIGEEEITLGDTFLIKLMLDNLTPTALANTYLETIKN